MNTSKERRILVTGSNGQLGRSIRRVFEERGVENVFFTDIEELDITNYEAVSRFVTDHDITHVINCAAFTRVDDAETDAINAAKLNTGGVSNIAQIAAKYKIKVLHVSTDYVFSGEAWRPYAENDEPYPRSIYGRTKLEGEGILMAFCPDAIIIRTSWLYSEFGNNFVRKMIQMGREKKDLKVVVDQIGTPTYASDLAEAIYSILHSSVNEPGIFHYANEGVASWYDFAKAIFRLSDMDVNVSPILSKEYPTKASRPLFSVFNKEKIKKTYALKIPHWEDSLRKCLSSNAF